MKKEIKGIIAVMIVYGIFMGLFCISVSLDLLFNPWIRELQLQWWNFFTTHHYLTWLFTNNLTLWLILVSIFALSVALPAGTYVYLSEN
jgi:hypothetical protein